MSDIFFPDLNLAYDFVKTPQFNTRIATSINGRELRACLQPQPKFQLQLSLPVLSDRDFENEFTTIHDFFLDRRGSFDSFLFKMLDDNSKTFSIIGNGSDTYLLIDGSTQYSNVKPQSSINLTPMMWNEDTSTKMWNENDSTLMWSDLVSFSIDKNGVLKTSKPINENYKFDVTVEYYYRCRFSEDSQQFTLFCEKLWKGEISLAASLGAHI